MIDERLESAGLISKTLTIKYVSLCGVTILKVWSDSVPSWLLTALVRSLTYSRCVGTGMVRCNGMAKE